MVNIRLGEKKMLRQSKPCDICQTLLIHYGISKVVYSTEDWFDIWESFQ